MASNTPAARLRDPFYVVREKVQLTHATITSDYARWRDLLDGGGSSEEVISLAESLKAALKTIRIDLADLQRTNTIVEKSRPKFKDIDDEELASRVKFCRDLDTGLDTMEDNLNNPTPLKRPEKTRKQLMDGGKRPPREPEATPSPVVQARQEQALVERQQQDVLVMEMADAVGRLKDIAVEANQALVEQGEGLKKLDGALDHAKHNMDVVLAKLNTLLGSSDRGKLCCIAFLVFLCALLLILIVYT